MSKAKRYTIDGQRFREALAAGHFHVAVALIQMAALDVAGHHGERAMLVSTAYAWSTDPSRIPHGPEAVAAAIGAMRGMAPDAPPVQVLWGRLIEVLEAIEAKYGAPA